VYHAYDPQFDREVALKTLLPHLAEDETVRRRFLAEARAITRLRHPNIVTMYETGEVDEQPYYTMEFVSGWTLEQVLRGTQSSLAEVLPLLEPLAEALDYLHEAGFVPGM